MGVVAQGVEEGGVDVGRGDGAGDGVASRFVRFANDLAATNAAPREDHRVAVRPVVAAGVGVDDWRASEIAHPDDERRIEQAAFGQVL